MRTLAKALDRDSTRHPLGVEPVYNKIGLVFKEVEHGLYFAERSGVKGETVA
ncbi:hypothetical protein PAE9249_04702 [Paenibacillus sp. CECT 9249]|uniref:hypothetical protein n=1 Tax=Paenibacillus sp. CECT 9249 TaxID=2845385 RepID=UPI001E443818|nr:hypothetical protein [Paenibacillus sp. CECT 9249]CAH0122160.1 hypothetical protein PAE9249_04702 [Paenibacillus sp. CECT 9249]